MDELQLRLAAAMRRGLGGCRERLATASAGLAGRTPATRIATLLQRLLHARARLLPGLRNRLALANARLESVARALHATSPIATLGRGYAIVTLAADGTLVSNAAQAPPGTEIDARLARGRLRARVL